MRHTIHALLAFFELSPRDAIGALAIALALSALAYITLVSFLSF
jgi:hypothetical protein